MGHCLCDPMFSRLSRTLTCDRQTDRHTTVANTALAWHCAVKREIISKHPALQQPTTYLVKCRIVVFSTPSELRPHTKNTLMACLIQVQ